MIKDLFVTKNFRRSGVAKAFMWELVKANINFKVHIRHIEKIKKFQLAKKGGMRWISWAVSNLNQPAMTFGEKVTFFCIISFLNH